MSTKERFQAAVPELERLIACGITAALREDAVDVVSFVVGWLSDSIPHAASHPTNSHEAIAQHLQRDKRGAPLDHLALFDRIDVNGDGVISRSEWCNAFENPASITLSEGELHELSRLDSGTEWSLDGWLASLGLGCSLGKVLREGEGDERRRRTLLELAALNSEEGKAQLQQLLVEKKAVEALAETLWAGVEGLAEGKRASAPAQMQEKFVQDGAAVRSFHGLLPYPFRSTRCPLDFMSSVVIFDFMSRCSPTTGSPPSSRGSRGSSALRTRISTARCWRSTRSGPTRSGSSPRVTTA